MTVRSRSPRPHAAARSSQRHPVAAHVGVALLAITLLTGVALVAAHGSSQTVEHDARERVLSNRDAAVRALVRQSEDFKRTVSTWAANGPVMESLSTGTPTSLAKVQDQLSTLARSKDSPLAFVSDTRGRTVALYPSQPELLGKDFAYQDWFKGVSTTGKPYVSEGYRSAATGRPLVVGVAAPVVVQSRIVGYIAVLWQLDTVRSVIDGSRKDDGVTLTMTDQRGQPLTSSLTFDDRGQADPAAVSPMTRQALAGTSVSSVHDGKLQATGPVPGLGWTVTASLPTSVALAPAKAFQRSLELTLGVALLCILLFTGLALRVARRLAAQQSAANEEQNRLTTLLAASPIGIIETRPDGTVLAVNEALADMLGYDVDDLLTMRGIDLVHPHSESAAASAQQGLLSGDLNGYTTERLFRARDGSAVPVQVSAVVNRGSDGELKRTVGFVVDQREQKVTAASLKALADTLAEREALLSTLFDTMDVAVIACDADGVSTMVNHQGRAMHGMTDDMAADTPGAMRMTYLDGRPMDPADSPLRRALTEGEVRDEELHVVTDDGRAPQRLLMHARRMTGPHGETVGAVVAAHDITAMHASEVALRASEDRFRRVFDEGLSGKLMANTEGSILRVNATLSRLLGCDPQQLIGQPLVSHFNDPTDQLLILELIQAGDGELRAEMAMNDANGRWLWGLVALSWLAEHDGPRVLLVQIEDITARRAAEQRLTELTLHDELTGLPNRRLLLERCERAFALARSGRGSSTTVAALFIDLDGFKRVNDRAGHDAGDQLLIAIARDLQTALRPSDTVARVGGDEFVVLLEREDGLEYLRTVADRITNAVRRQVSADGASLSVSASVGIARVDLATEPDLPPDQLLRRADAAMYRAKERGRDRHDVFDAELHDRTEARQALEQAMRDGLQNDRVALVFQPVIDVDSGVVVGAEALMRLKNAQGRLLPTLPAIVAAETAGLAEALGDRVLRLALTAARTWPDTMTVAVNISSRELTGKDLRNRVEQALKLYDFDPSRLILEITESSILSAGPSALAELEKLRVRGVRVAIDDFGTAYATLQNLTTLHVDALKVDTSFTAGLPDQRTHTAVVHGIASMAYELDIPCIIEGVETEAQLAAIRGLAVQAQGWFWGKPQGSEHIPLRDQVPIPRIDLDAPAKVVAAKRGGPVAP